MRTLTFVLSVLTAAPALAAPPRSETRLSGAWERLAVEELAEPPAGGAWTPVAVPGYLRGHDYQRAWFRRTFTVPAAMKGQRIKICFGGVKYNSRVFVNGKRVGGCFGGYQPFEVDVTDAVRLDGPNVLAVGVHDWTGVFAAGPKVDFAPTTNWQRVRGMPRDRILAPIGGLYGLYGIWDDVTLRSHPAVHVRDLFIKTSVRRGEVSVEYELANESGRDAEVEVRPAIEDGGRDVLRLMPARVLVKAGRTAKVTISQRWEKPRLWSHVDPHLYRLRTELRGVPRRPPAGLKPAGGAGPAGGEVADLVRTRFGFREFWVEGHRFFLNGVPVNLLATSWWPPHGPMSKAEVEQRWKAIKRAGCVAFRTHTQPWRPVHYEVADELGLLMIVEGAVWNDDQVYRVKDPAFWDNYAKHLRAMVDRDKNRASVVMWSLENELTGGRVNDDTPFAKSQLIRMGRLVKQWDPTRPIFYESDGDPGGVADVIGIHYPHEYPSYTCWPNEAYWLDKPIRGSGGGGIFLNGEPHFLWKKRKPLYIGEFLWLPSSNPSWHTVFFGDEAYVDYRRYRNLGKAESWKMQVLGYRHHEVAGISPWTVIEGGPLDETNPLYQAHQYAYQHIAAYCLDYDTRFYGGETITRRVEVFNDVMTPSDLTLTWALAASGRVADRGDQKLRLGPAEHRMLHIEVRTPRVAARTPLAWRLTLERGGEQVFADTQRWTIFPRPHAPAAPKARFGLLDADGSGAKLLARFGIGKPRAVPSLRAIPGDIDVLVVGPRALKAGKAEAQAIGRVAPERGGLLRFLRRGGRALVLEQTAYPAGLFDVSLTRQQSTMTFPGRPDHPALRGVEPGDLKFWAGGHIVATNEPPRPTAGSGVPIIVSGSRSGVANAPLLERQVGDGCLMLCQLRLAGDPAADRILGNLLTYLAEFKPARRKTALVGGSKAYRDYLRSLGLRFDDLTGKLGTADLRPYSLIVARGTAGSEAKLRRYVEAGGNLLLHRLAVGASADRACEALGVSLVLQPYAGHVARAEGDDPLLRRFFREDLYWLGKHVGIGWSTTPLATDVADAAFGLSLEGKPVRTFEVEDWAIEGHIVEKREPGVTFATVGSASHEVDFPQSGTYIIGVRARGTPCRGGYPVARISIDGKRFGAVSAADAAYRTYTTFGHVAKGRHKLSVAFINDASDPPTEDRNLYVDKVLVAHEPKRTDVTFLTAPPAVAFVRRGKGTVVFDQLRWDTESANARKAARYASTLLTELGGDFAPRSGVALECETMTPQPGVPHFRATGTAARMACSGYIETQATIAAAGRYTLEIVASGTPCGGIYPHVKVTLDGGTIGEAQLTSGGWRSYLLPVELPEGSHQLRIYFTNDSNLGGEDRNLALDKVVFYRE